MPLQRKVGTKGDSLDVVIPHQIADFHGITEGTVLEFQPVRKGELKIVALAKMCKVKLIGGTETRMVEEKDGECIPPKGWEIIK